jgi:hypothetical protein
MYPTRRICIPRLCSHLHVLARVIDSLDHSCSWNTVPMLRELALTFWLVIVCSLQACRTLELQMQGSARNCSPADIVLI